MPSFRHTRKRIYTRAQGVGAISHCDALEVPKMMAFFPVALIFVATIFLNMKSLEHANVETFMIFRFSTQRTPASSLSRGKDKGKNPC